MKKLVAVVILLSFVFCSCAFADSKPGPIEKLNTGLWNILSSPGEILYSVTENRTGTGLLAGTSHGLLEGLSRFVVKGATGIVEVGTFLVPWPNGYRPILESTAGFKEQGQ
jgi:putative exosortase-associated protein (TIGR04073 family)